MAAEAAKTAFEDQRQKWKDLSDEIAEKPALSMLKRSALLADNFISITFTWQATRH